MVHENWSWYKLSCWLAGCAVIACSLGLQAARQSNATAATTVAAATAVLTVVRLHDCRLFRWLVAFRISKWLNITIKLGEEQNHLKPTIPEC